MGRRGLDLGERDQDVRGLDVEGWSWRECESEAWLDLDDGKGMKVENRGDHLIFISLKARVLRLPSLGVFGNGSKEVEMTSCQS